MAEWKRVLTRRIRVVVSAIAYAFAAACGRRGIQPSRAVSSGPENVSRCVPEYPQLTNAAANLPPLPRPQGGGYSVLIGYVADSTTGHGLRGARVLLRPAAAPRWHDTVYTDGAAGFVFSSLNPGKYEYIAQSMNFQAEKGSIDISSKAETVRVRLRRAGLCNVTVGPLVEPIVRKLPPPR
jgi:hypothetical protein